jgi:diguanylate cyclase (GGDEF)-like protein
MLVLLATAWATRGPAPDEPWRELLWVLPQAALGVAVLLGLLFNRGRVVYAALALWILVGIEAWVRVDPEAEASRVMQELGLLWLALALAGLGLLGESAVLTRAGVLRLLFFLLPLGLARFWTSPQGTSSVEWMSDRLEAARMGSLGVASVIAVFSLLALGFQVVRRRSPIEGALAGALLAAILAAFLGGSLHRALGYLTAGGVILAVGVIHESHRLAFHDELTGLPGRRALNEALQTLEGGYAIAMIDVDHFKRFNDTHGHEVGDQILRLVATRIQRVGGAGQSFRYGGEEFAILFPGRSESEVLRELESLRSLIAKTPLTLRDKSRPRRKPKTPPRQRGTKQVSVTISIGVAQRTDRLDTPDLVIAAADRALYRAKEGGRNQVASAGG